MTNKFEYYSDLADRQSRQLTESYENWTEFLKTAGRIYKYPFSEQVLIYAQRPNITACAPIEIWNKPMNRYVKRGSKGIALIDDTSTIPRLKYVFDYNDTAGGKNAKKPFFWKVEYEHKTDVLQSLLEFEFNTDSKDNLENIILDLAKSFAARYYNDNRQDILFSAEGSFLEELDEYNIGLIFKETLAASLAYCVMSRCNINADSYIDKEVFQPISNFNSSSSLYALGKAVSELSEQILRDIERTVRKYERNKLSERRDNYENELSSERGLSDTEYNDERNDGGYREVRNDEEELSQRTEGNIVHHNASAGETLSSPFGNRQDSEQATGTDDRGNDQTIAAAGQGNKSNGLGGSYELAESGGGRSDIQGTDIHLNDNLDTNIADDETDSNDNINSLSDDIVVTPLFPPEKEQREKIISTVISQEDIDNALIYWNGDIESRNKVYEYMKENGRSRATAVFLQNEYGFNLSCFIVKKDGAEPVKLSWQKVQLRIGQLIANGRFTSEKEDISITETENLSDEFEQSIEIDPTAETEKTINETVGSGTLIEENNLIKPIKKPITDKPVNFIIKDDNLGEVGAKTRFKNNVEAIKTLQLIEFENRSATQDEQEILSRYTGWGGIPQAFDENNENWSKEYSELKSLINDKEYNSAMASTLNAHYTSPLVIKAIYKAISNMGFEFGNILEPSCGVGNFFGLLPDKMKKSKLFGVELDSLTGRIAKQLYPKADIQITGFENTDFQDNFFDIAIGNVPFGAYKVVDKKYDKQNFFIHDYFFAKTLDKIRAGGIIAFITSKGTMDKQNPDVRKYIAERAELIGAIRLPDNAFLKNAGTEVTTDILFFQKRERILDIVPDWLYLGETENGVPVNSYFLDNPDMVLGTMVFDDKMYGNKKGTTCVPFENSDLSVLLDNAIKRIKGQITIPNIGDIDKSTDNYNYIPADSSVKNFSYAVFRPSQLGIESKTDDKIVYYRENSSMYPVELSEMTKKRIKGMVEIRNAVNTLINFQLGDYHEDMIKQAQRELNNIYDSFKSKFGLINSGVNKKAFSQDSSYYLLSSLEVLDEDRNFKRKADIFTRRTINKKITVTSVDTASEALVMSVAEKAKVDFEYMSELTGMDKNKLISDLKGVIFKVPVTEVWVTADEYLSGNVREKLRTAKFYAEKNPEFEINVTALEKVQPKDLAASDIAVRLGTTWIDTEYIEQFIFEVLKPPNYLNDTLKVDYSKYTSEWHIQGKNQISHQDVTAYTTYGTSRISAYEILEDSLNLRDVRIYDRVENPDGKHSYVLNKNETAAAQQKQEQLKQAFKDWIFKDPKRRETLVELYNELFNSIRPREFDGSHINFVGMNPEITLRPHQRNAVAHALYGGNTLLAHEVGAGKTFEMIAIAMESKRLGLCQKSLIAVPNHLTEQLASDFLTLYPGANILVATKKDFETKNRKRFCARIATGEYDAVIIGHTQLEKIPISLERQKRMLQEQIDEVVDGIKELKTQKAEKFSIKRLEKTKKSLEGRLKKLNDEKRKDDVVTFEQLGVDRLFVDEADSFKNLFLYTKMRNVAGLNQSEAQKSSDLFMKCRYLDELTGSKGCIFATGTPVSNSMTEIYTMQKYLQYDTLEKKGLIHFDQWASTFGETVNAIELAPQGGGYRYKTRFSKFYNLPELMNIFKEVADIKTIDMMPEIVRPNANYETVVVKPSELQEKMVEKLGERAAKIQNGNVDPKIDNMLKITSDGRKIGLDQRLINNSLPDFEDSKVNACMKNIYRIWNETSEKKSTQLVFCDFSTPNKDGRFNVYDDIKEKLIKKGIPEKEIAFIHDCTTEIQKKELFAKVRQGKVRVLFGSTFKLGAGTNLQDKLIAMHDLDCPWRPRDLEQRAGRILRQGNENSEVHIYRYVTESTFDSYLYQTIENKQKFISQIMSSKSPVRSCDDVDESVLSYAEIKALCAGNPLIKERMDLDIEVARLKLLKSSYQNQRYRLEDSLLKYFPQKIKIIKNSIEGYKNDIKKIENNTHFQEEGISPMIVGNMTYANRSEAGTALIEAGKKLKPTDFVKIGEYRGFELQIKYNLFSNSFEINLKGNMSYQIDLGSDGAGNITRINNVLKEIPDIIKNRQDELENLHIQIKNAEEELKNPFPYEEELKEKTKRLAFLDSQLNLDNNDSNSLENNNEVKEECMKAKPSILQTLKEKKQIIEKQKNNIIKQTPDVIL